MRNCFLKVCATTLALLLSGCGSEPPAKKTYKAEQPIAAQLAILSANGTVGRTAAVLDGYRPQVLFADAGDGLSCTVHLTKGSGIEPGQSADVTLSCEKDVTINLKKIDFQLLEGGRKIGKGHILIP